MGSTFHVFHQPEEEQSRTESLSTRFFLLFLNMPERQSMSKPTLIVLIGPTGIGKTDLSLSIAETYHTSIISADSRQLYADLKIGTAAPTSEQLARVPHYFVGTLQLNDYYSAAQYETEVLKKLEEKIIPRLAETRFALIEFSMGTPYKEIHTALDRLLHLGVTPVVAHIERYKCLEKNEERVQEMIDMGCYMQINSSSVLKPRLFGDEQKQLKKRARYFLEKDLVHFVASDMHNVDKRPPYMAEAYRLIKEEYGEQRAQALFVSNQELLLADELI